MAHWEIYNYWEVWTLVKKNTYIGKSIIPEITRPNWAKHTGNSAIPETTKANLTTVTCIGNKEASCRNTTERKSHYILGQFAYVFCQWRLCICKFIIFWCPLLSDQFKFFGDVRLAILTRYNVLKRHWSALVHWKWTNHKRLRVFSRVRTYPCIKSPSTGN